MSKNENSTNAKNDKSNLKMKKQNELLEQKLEPEKQMINEKEIIRDGESNRQTTLHNEATERSKNRKSKTKMEKENSSNRPAEKAPKTPMEMIKNQIMENSKKWQKLIESMQEKSSKKMPNEKSMVKEKSILTKEPKTLSDNFSKQIQTKKSDEHGKEMSSRKTAKLVQEKIAGLVPEETDKCILCLIREQTRKNLKLIEEKSKKDALQEKTGLKISKSIEKLNDLEKNLLKKEVLLDKSSTGNSIQKLNDLQIEVTIEQSKSTTASVDDGPGQTSNEVIKTDEKQKSAKVIFCDKCKCHIEKEMEQSKIESIQKTEVLKNVEKQQAISEVKKAKSIQSNLTKLMESKVDKKVINLEKKSKVKSSLKTMTKVLKDSRREKSILFGKLNVKLPKAISKDLAEQFSKKRTLKKATSTILEKLPMSSLKEKMPQENYLKQISRRKIRKDHQKIMTQSQISQASIERIIVPAPQEPIDYYPIQPGEYPKSQIIQLKYEIKNKVGSNNVAEVFKCKLKDSEEMCAIKVFNIESLGPLYSKLFIPEDIESMIKLRHRYLIKIHSIFREKNSIFIIMDYANGGDLSYYLEKNGPLSESLASYWFTQICKALKYLHLDLKTAHRNIKTENILFVNNIAKLSDFTFAKRCWDDQNNKPLETVTYCGSDRYFSPKKIQLQPYDPFADDIWAMGVVLFIMLHNRFPFDYSPKDDVYDYSFMNDPNYLNEFIKQYPSDLKDLHRKLLMIEENIRITIDQILMHKWIQRKKLTIYFKRKIPKERTKIAN